MAGSVVQHVFAVDDSGVGSTTISVTINGVAAGNTLVAHVGWASASATCSVSDGTAYASVDGPRDDTINGQRGQVFSRENSGAGNFTITATFSESVAYRRIRVYEIAGLQPTGNVHRATGQAQTPAGTTTDSVSSGAMAATTIPNCFILGCSQNSSEASPGSGTLSAGTNYTLVGTNLIMGGEHRRVSVTGSYAATFTQSINNHRITHAIAFAEVQLPAITSISPSSAAEDGSGFTLTVNGANFVSGAVVRWAGSDRATTFVSATQLTATINAADITTPGGYAVTVRNPDAQTSNAIEFGVTTGSARARVPWLGVPFGSRGWLGAGISGATYWATASDALTLADSATAQAAFSVTASDAAAAADSATAQAIFAASGTDAAALSDSTTATAVFAAAAVDAAALADQASGGLLYASNASDALTLTDSADASPAINSTASDAVTLADSASAGAVFSCSASDAIALSDAAGAQAVLACGATDVLAIADAAGALAQLNCSASDAITLADSATAAFADLDRTATDAMSLSDQAAAGAIFNITVSDAMFLTDAAIAEGGAGGSAGSTWLPFNRRRRGR